MEVKDVLQFLVSELRKGISENAKERILELGSAVDILYEVAKERNDKNALDVLEKLNYIVFHYDEEFSFTEQYFQQIEKEILINAIY